MIVLDGGLGGLIACWVAFVASKRSADRLSGSDGRGNLAWIAAPSMPTFAQRARAAAKQADLCQCRVVEGSPSPVDSPTQLLLAAAEVARSQGLSRVVWPIHAAEMRESFGVGDDASDLDVASGICDRAMLVSQLAALDVTAGNVVEPCRIETPYADFTDRQLVDLAVDMDAPLWAAWCCREGGPRACGQCPGCKRLAAAIEAVIPGASERLTLEPVGTRGARLAGAAG